MRNEKSSFRTRCGGCARHANVERSDECRANIRRPNKKQRTSAAYSSAAVPHALKMRAKSGPVTTSAAARLANRSEATIRGWERRGLLPAVKKGTEKAEPSAEKPAETGKAEADPGTGAKRANEPLK